MNIPIIIISFNNYIYVKNMVNQLLKVNQNLINNIIILDNKSTCEKTIDYLKNTNIKVIFNESNEGPWVSPQHNRNLYYSLPNKFILTDPDLELNTNLPHNFIEIIDNISNKYNTFKIGFALDISNPDELIDDKTYFLNQNIHEWETQFWNNRINDDEYELYNADIDTTFCLINKFGNYSKRIRIAGNYTAKHLPWYKDNPVINIFDNYLLNSQQTKISTTSKVILNYIAKDFIKVYKNDIFLFIKNDISDPNLPFWENIYKNWENETFEIFDKYLDKDKVFIDIGSGFGATTIYASRKSKHVYSFNDNIESFRWLERNCKINCTNCNLFNNNCFFNYFEENEILYNDISLIKVDIKGSEESILNDLYLINNKHKIPVFVKFNYLVWKDKNLDRFQFLTNKQKKLIDNNPEISILL